MNIFDSWKLTKGGAIGILVTYVLVAVIYFIGYLVLGAALLGVLRPPGGRRRFARTDLLLEAATVVFRGETYRMREVPTASGNLYTDGARAWRGAATSRMFAEADGDAGPPAPR